MFSVPVTRPATQLAVCVAIEFSELRHGAKYGSSCVDGTMSIQGLELN